MIANAKARPIVSQSAAPPSAPMPMSLKLWRGAPWLRMSVIAAVPAPTKTRKKMPIASAAIRWASEYSGGGTSCVDSMPGSLPGPAGEGRPHAPPRPAWLSGGDHAVRVDDELAGGTLVEVPVPFGGLVDRDDGGVHRLGDVRLVVQDR